jgi:retinoid hydroxylase
MTTSPPPAAAKPLPLPPGRSGLPLLGETHLLLRDGFGFVEQRARQHGPIFRTRILGRKTAVITGPDATALFVDGNKVQREGAMPGHIQTLFGGHALPVLDGEAHRERKHFIMAGFSREAVAWYVPTLHRLTADYFRRWSAQPDEMRWADELEQLALEGIGETLMGIPPGPVMDELRRLYAIFFRGFAALPIPLPGTAFSRAKRVLRRILAIHRQNVDAHLARPRTDGLSRILAAKSPLSDTPPAPEDIARELHHLVIAGLIVRAWFATLILELERQPDIRRRLADEILRVAPDGPLSLERIDQMPYLEQVASEVRRLSPVVHVFFGKAREAIEFAGHTIPSGWTIFWGIRSSHLKAEIYPDPERFDPERFSSARAESQRHPYAFAPNGAGGAMGHKCAGYELAPLMLKVFAVELLRGHDWQLSSPQDLDLAWNQVPPMPKDGLRVRVTPAAAERAPLARSQ